MFLCHFCPHETSALNKHIHHRLHHRHITAYFHCGLDGCRSNFLSEASLRSHLSRFHKVGVRAGTNSLPLIQNNEAKFVCSLDHCKKVFDDQGSFMKHLKFHILSGLSIECPARGCSKRYSNCQSLSGHLSKCHNSKVTPTFVDPRHVPTVGICEENFDSEPPIQYDDGDDCALSSLLSDDTEGDLFLDTLAQFCLKLEFKFMIPAKVVQLILQEFCLIQKQDHHLLKENLTKKLKNELPAHKIDGIIDYAFNNNVVTDAYKMLKSDFLRKNHYKHRLAFVSPVPLPIPPKVEGGESHIFHYIPIKETIKALFSDRSLHFKLAEPRFSDDPKVLKDYTDGFVFKENPFFQENPLGLQIILYQDAFEVVCPLGPAKKKYKMIGVYMLIGNLPVHLRSRVNSIQLVALCVEKHFQHKAVYGPIVEDLKDLESNGIQISGHGLVKGSLVLVVGDNLGSHGLGGFVESFSKATYFCRYCEITHKAFHASDGELVGGTPRTADSYNQCIDRLNQMNRQKKIYKGIKFNSVFNELQSFHVCLPGLAPCLAHDLFEGLIAYDLKLFIDYFVQEGWFSFNDLNKLLKTFPFTLSNKRDRPIPVEETSARVKGGAWQVCVFLMTFPLIVRNHIKDENDEVWRALMLLIEIVEIVICHSCNTSYLPFLQSCLEEYVRSRKTLFPHVPLRPKHHYFGSHYAELFLAFGSLIRVFTLRFESKHSFFKRYCRATRNFINITLSCAMKHELHQAYLRTGADFTPEVKAHDATAFIMNNYSVEIRCAVEGKVVPASFVECSKVDVKGTTYKRGDVVACGQDGYQHNVNLGRISIILVNDFNDVYFVVENLTTNFIPHLRVYDLGPTVSYSCVNCDTLLSFQPLDVYKLDAHSYGKLRSALVSNDNDCDNVS